MWQRVVLWAILAINALAITLTPIAGELARSRRTEDIYANMAIGKPAEVTRIERVGERRDDHDVIRMNTAWVCLTLSVIGLAITRQRPS